MNTEIEYIGAEGITAHCIKAVMRYIQCGEEIEDVRIVTYDRSHALLLTLQHEREAIVRSGFASGYHGEGSVGFASVLSLFEDLQIPMDECEVSAELMEKLNAARLINNDLDTIRNAPRVRPTRIYDYMYEVPTKPLWGRFPEAIPHAVIDTRIRDLSISFWDAPADRIFDGYRRLEEIVRDRCKTEDFGGRLFGRAFVGEKSLLTWPGLLTGEQRGRGLLFTAAFDGFRNVRAHKEVAENSAEQLSEFLLLNQLFRLEREAVERVAEETSS